jgi:putative DNA primase/helicase
LAFFSCWCPKVISRIGKLPDTLADRCIVIRMHRKTTKETCDRVKNLTGDHLRRKCARLVHDHGAQIADACPEIPASLNDRAADIWEPLLALAGLAGGEWPTLARHAAVTLSATTPESNPIGALLLDIWQLFVRHKTSRIFSSDLVRLLAALEDRPWQAGRKSRELTELWLAAQLRPFGVRPRNIWIDSEQRKGYLQTDFAEIFTRYVSKSEAEAFFAESKISDFPPPHEEEHLPSSV